MIARVAGVLLAVLTLAPLHRLLVPERAGPAGEATRATAEAAWSSTLFGTAFVLAVAVVLARAFGAEAPRRAGRMVMDRLAAVPDARWPWMTGILALVLSSTLARLVFRGLPTSVDEMTQLAHAAALAGGSPALPLDGSAASWIVQNGIATPVGWASIYAPGHTLLLAAGLALGAAWLVGPLSVGVATGLFAAAVDRVIPERGAGRAASLLLAVSPYWLLLGSTHLSHASAAAWCTAVFYAAARARDGGG